MINNVNYNKNFDKLTKGFSIPDALILRENPTAIKAEKPQDTTKFTDKPDKNKKTLGKKVLYAVLAIGTVALILTKGFSGSTAKKISNYADILENDLLKKAGDNKIVQYVDNGLSNTYNFVKRMFSLSNAIANFTAVKDSLFKKFYSLDYVKFKNPETMKFKKLAKSWNWLMTLPTKFFNFASSKILKITESAIDSRYTNVTGALDKYNAECSQIIDKSRATKEAKENAFSILNNLFPTYMEGFSKSSRNERLNNLNNNLVNLPEKVYNIITDPFKVLFSKRIPITARLRLMGRRFKRNYASYITVAQSNTARLQHQRAVNKAKIAFSNDISDIAKTLKHIANDLKHSFNAKDIQNRQIFGDILRKIEKYGSLSGSSELTVRKELQNEIISDLDSILSKIIINTENKGSNISYSQVEINNIKNLVESMKLTMNEYSKKGIIQEFLANMKNILSEKDYKLLKLKTQQLTATFNNAVDAELGNMVDKYAEARVGSIPTDVVNQGIVLGTGAYYIASSDDKKEKLGAALKVGMPIIGGIATYFYSASKALSGTTNLIYTALTGFILNRIGDTAFNYYQKRFVENKPVNEIAKEAIDEATKV